MDIGSFFKQQLADTHKLVVLGIGSALKADDAAGVRVATRLIKQYPCGSDTLRVFNGSTAPENYTGAIKAFAPDHVILIDAADMGEEPGTVSVISPEAVAGVSFSTHTLPLSILMDYLIRETGCVVTVIGVQPLDVSFGGRMTKPVRQAVSQIVEALEAVLSDC